MNQDSGTKAKNEQNWKLVGTQRLCFTLMLSAAAASSIGVRLDREGLQVLAHVSLIWTFGISGRGCPLEEWLRHEQKSCQIPPGKVNVSSEASWHC